MIKKQQVHRLIQTMLCFQKRENCPLKHHLWFKKVRISHPNSAKALNIHIQDLDKQNTQIMHRK